MALTYAQLTQALQDYCETDETEFVNNIPVFVRQAEDRILNAVQLPEFRKNSTGTMTAGNPYLSLPSDYLSCHSVAVDNSGYEFLLLKDVSYIREMYPGVGAQGTPKVFAVFSEDSFLLGPTPDAAYTAELHYFHRPESIVTASTSWLGTNAESCLLYGCLVEAYTFLFSDTATTEIYTGRYQEALMALKGLGEGRMQTDDYRADTKRMQRL
jgi:hypothetical protein